MSNKRQAKVCESFCLGVNIARVNYRRSNFTEAEVNTLRDSAATERDPDMKDYIRQGAEWEAERLLNQHLQECRKP